MYSSRKLQDQVDILIVLEMVVEFEDVGMVQRVHDPDFIRHLFDHVRLLEQLLLNNLDCVGNISFLMGDLLHNTEGAYS